MIVESIAIRLCGTHDAKFLLKMRIDNGEYLSATSGKLQDQISWLRDYKSREEKGLEYYFIIEEVETEIGCVRLYNIDQKNKSFTFGSFIVDKNLSKNKLNPVITMIKVFDFAFDKLKLEDCFFDCRVDNVRANNFYQKFGAVKIGQDQADIFYKYTKKDHIKRKGEILKTINND